MRLSYVERRDLALRFAVDLPGWECVRLVGDRHIGRVLMARKYGHRAGFYPVGSTEYNMITTSATSFQRAQTSRLK